MLFFEYRFIVFFVIVFFLYNILRTKKRQNVLLLIASYVFYGSWNWKFLSLMLLSTIIDYVCGIKVGKEVAGDRTRKKYLLVSVVCNLGILGVFKYFNFFVSEFVDFMRFFGVELNFKLWSFVLPAGISFYTFQTMSYTIDVYRRNLKPVKNFVTFATFVSFFPQLVAGPIERAGNLIVQLEKDRKITVDDFFLGLRLYIWGVFKKIVVADNLAKIVDDIMASPEKASAWTFLVAGTAFAFQIYGDFSGYTDMARGIAQMMGFHLSENFNLPYFAKGIRDFWRRWHISLSNWLRDYIYIPLGGSKRGEIKTYENLMITMLLGGLWHGASWHFVLWGGTQGALMSIERFMEGSYIGNICRRMPESIKIIITFPIIVLGWLIFRVNHDSDLWILADAFFNHWEIMNLFNFLLEGELGHISALINMPLWIQVIRIVAFLIVIQLFQYTKKDLLFDLELPAIVRAFLYVSVLYGISFFSAGVSPQFIYFQF